MEIINTAIVPLREYEKLKQEHAEMEKVIQDNGGFIWKEQLYDHKGYFYPIFQYMSKDETVAILQKTISEQSSQIHDLAKTISWLEYRLKNLNWWQLLWKSKR